MTLSAHEVTVRLGGSRVLGEGVTVSFEPGVTCLVGENGAGKTTLLRALATLVRPTSGTVRYRGRDVWADSAARHDLRAALGWVPQTTRLPRAATPATAVSYAAWLKKVADPNAVADTLALCDLHARRDRPIGRLSGGEQRRVLLAMGLVGAPGVLLLDEPTAGLDPAQRETFLAIVTGGDSDRVVVLSTHLMEDVARAADHILLLDEGALVDVGSPAKGGIARLQEVFHAKASRGPTT